MPDLARRHQSKQGPCRLRGGRRRPLEPLIVESVAGGILAPAAVLVLNREQPVHRLAERGILVVDAGGVERAENRPRPPPPCCFGPSPRVGPASKRSAR